MGLENGMIWTAISYNWSVGLTNYFVFSGAHSATEASQKFAETYPGENLLALVAGHHATSTTIFPLLTPGIKLNPLVSKSGV